MSNAKFTPGPWSVAGKEYGWDHFAAVVTPTGIVANCHIASLSRSHEQTAADAHLIAAAPELYEALEALMADWPADHLPARDTCVKAAIALAKARGEQA